MDRSRGRSGVRVGGPFPRRACLACVAASVLTGAWSCTPVRGGANIDAATTTSPGAASRHRFTGTAMGCVVSITIDEDDPARARDAARAGLLELDRLDATYSDWKRSSELSRLNDDPALRTTVSAEFAGLLGRALEVAEATDGRFDPTVGALVALWRLSRTSGRLPDAATLAAARAQTGWRAIRVVDATTVERSGTGLRLDFGGIAKGEGAIRALSAIEAAGCPRAIVAVAGDIACGDAPRGEAGWTVEVARERSSHASPQQPLRLARRAISTSGGSMQWIEVEGARYAHIVDPRSGLGAMHLAQATVVGPLDPAVDALGTALALTDDDAQAAAILDRFPGYEAIIERDGVARHVRARPE